MKKMLTVMAATAMLVVPFAAPASADTAACKIGVHVHERPGYSTDPIYVETGEYEPYTDCLSDPPIIIHHEPICTYKPQICV